MKTFSSIFNTLNKPLIVAIVVLVIFLRAPNLFYDPRFWAEEAFVYYATAHKLAGFEALLAPHMGYYSLWSNMAGYLASLLPMAQAPYATLLMSLLAQLIPVALILAARIPVGLWARCLMIAAYVLVTPTGEVWLNTINSQFFFAISAALMIALPDPGKQSRVQVVLLFLMGLSSPVVCFLGLVALIAFLQERSPYRLEQLWALGLATLIQIGVIVSVPQGGRITEFDLATFFVYGVRQITLLFTGFFPARLLVDFAEPQLAAGTFGIINTVIFASVYCGFTFLLYKLTPYYLRRIVLASVILSFFMSIAALGDQALILTIYERYYTPPTLLFAIALASVAVTQSDWIGWIAAAGLTCAVGIGSLHYFFGGKELFSGPSWAAEVEDYAHNPLDPIVIWPSFWVFRPEDPISEVGSWPSVEEVRQFGATRLDGMQ
ncbi:hypothetical protein ACEWPM_016860 [Roseovarius sp. S4756]|uniref:hypothetical protein n=1 Tax=Roseovarius maritimus TaxID=3342637 RepID=UPI003726A2C2